MANEASHMRDYERELLLEKVPGGATDAIWLEGGSGHIGAYDLYLEIMQDDAAEEEPLPELDAGQQADLDLQIRPFENGLSPLQQPFWERAQQQRADMQGPGYPKYVNNMFGVVRFISHLSQGTIARSRQIVEALGDPAGSAQFEESMNEQA